MLYGKGAPICDLYNCRGAGKVFVGYPSNELYKVESIYDCAENQLMYDSANYLITREGHVCMHIKTDAAISLKNQVEQSMQRRENASDLLKGL